MYHYSDSCSKNSTRRTEIATQTHNELSCRVLSVIQSSLSFFVIHIDWPGKVNFVWLETCDNSEETLLRLCTLYWHRGAAACSASVVVRFLLIITLADGAESFFSISHSARQESLAFYGTQRLITMFIGARHWSVSWAIRIQLTTSNPIFRSILILSSLQNLGLPSGIFQVFRLKLCIHFSSPHACYKPRSSHPTFLPTFLGDSLIYEEPR